MFFIFRIGPNSSKGDNVNLVYFIGWCLCRLFFTVYCPRRCYNLELVPSGPVILASNHESFIDPFLVGAVLKRPLHFLARDNLFRSVIGMILRVVNAVPVNREGGGAAGLRAILGRLQDGGGILIFPEGTRTSDGHLQQGRSGIGLLVLESSPFIPVVPVRVLTYNVWGRHRPIPQPGRVFVQFGEAMFFKKLREEARSCSKTRRKEICQEIADRVMTAIAQLKQPK